MKKKSELVEVGRLAFRVEGKMWNVYYAAKESMDRAILMGSLRMNFATEPELKSAFMDLMQQAFEVAAQGAFGITPEWKEPKEAPEHEKSGHS